MAGSPTSTTAGAGGHGGGDINQGGDVFADGNQGPINVDGRITDQHNGGLGGGGGDINQGPDVFAGGGRGGINVDGRITDQHNGGAGGGSDLNQGGDVFRAAPQHQGDNGPFHGARPQQQEHQGGRHDGGGEH